MVRHDPLRAEGTRHNEEEKLGEKFVGFDKKKKSFLYSLIHLALSGGR